MTSYDDAEQLRQQAAELKQYSLRLWVVLSLIVLLATMAILSKERLATLWIWLAALIVPSSIALYFRNRIVLFGPVAYAATLIVVLAAAVLFGT